MKKFEDAINEYKKILQLQPYQETRFWLDFGGLLMEAGREQEADKGQNALLVHISFEYYYATNYNGNEI